ncbi:MAG TPA: alpha/beta hydrolase-fold protein [Bryobacteraceae bacterium]|nr:alpha/beta hydrolase-fold protein [Bryobacteraceae bacterium]
MFAITTAMALLQCVAAERFEISFPKEASAAAVDGHMMLVISTEEKPEPRFQISFSGKTQQAFGLDVEALAPGAAAVVDATTLGYPRDSLKDIPAGDYYVQAVLNIYETFHLANGHTVKLPPDKGEGQHWQSKPGNLYSRAQKVHLDAGSDEVIRLSLTEKVPAVPPADSDTKWIKHVKIRSELLSRFWGRPVELGAVLLLPDGWEDHPTAHYPLIVYQNHFNRGLGIGFTSMPGPGQGYKLYQDWTAGRMPRVIIVTIQHATPYFDDSYAVNSANAGPYGDAITQELIPYVERTFRGIGQGWARAVYGGSTGGWEALASQVFYPDFYNGAYVFCPDVVDFRAYMTMNLYEDKNAFWVEGPFARVPRPAMRQADGLLVSTMEQMNRFELVQGTKSRSGEQLDAWQAYFSSVGEDGYPTPVFDKRTGEIDHKVAAYWKERYDLTHIMERDWKSLGPKLAGKLHVCVGDADSFYLDRAVHLLQDFMETTTDPYYRGTFDFGQRKPHCYAGNFDPQVGLNQHYVPEMVKHMEETAPKGADTASWKY